VRWPLWIVFDLCVIRILYNLIISRRLGMVRFSYADGARVPAEGRYAVHLGWAGRTTLRLWKSSALALAMLLEQI